MPPVATPEPTLVASPTPTPSPTSTPVAYGPVRVATSTGRCPTADLGQATVGPDGVKQFQGGTFTCTVTTDEPRVSCTETALWSIDLWGTASNGALVQWGPARLDTAGGVWEGTGSGVYPSDRGDIIAFWYTGIGGVRRAVVLRAVDGSGALDDPGPGLPRVPADLLGRTGQPTTRLGRPVADRRAARLHGMSGQHAAIRGVCRELECQA